MPSSFSVEFTKAELRTLITFIVSHSGPVDWDSILEKLWDALGETEV